MLFDYMKTLRLCLGVRRGREGKALGGEKYFTFFERVFFWRVIN